MPLPKNDLKKNISLDYLLELSKGNESFVREMIDTFLEENPKEVAALEKAVKEKNFEAIRQTAHFLLSSIPFVGLDKVIGNELYDIEKTAAEILPVKNGSETERKQMIEKIGSMFSRIKTACEKARIELKETNLDTLLQRYKAVQA